MPFTPQLGISLFCLSHKITHLLNFVVVWPCSTTCVKNGAVQLNI